MLFGPTQIHSQEHLGPVGGLGAARPRGDRKERVAFVVLAGEEEGGALPLEVGHEAAVLDLDLGLHAPVGRGKLAELDEVARAAAEVVPRGQLRAQGIGAAEDALGGAGVVPEIGLSGRLLEAVELGLLGG